MAPHKQAVDGAPKKAARTGLNKLSATFVRQTTKPGVYVDGGGLRFQVTKKGSRRWFMRVTVEGQPKDIALGSAKSITMAEAREMAAAIRKAMAEGRDPLTVMRAPAPQSVAAEPPEAAPEETPAAEAQPSAPTFEQAWLAFWELKAPRLSSDKNRMLWENMMKTYVLPHIGRRAVADIRPAEIIDMLKPIWRTKEETGRKVLQRTSAVFTSAITREWRERANPCDGVSRELGQKRMNAKNFAAMPYRDVPGFLRDLRTTGGRQASRLCLEFLILTATRSQEARGARWREFDLAARLWVIPGNRMKMGEPHRIPLSDRAMAILAEARAVNPEGDLVFPSTRGEVFSDMTLLKRLRDMGLGGKATVHGFRSAFKDWCADSSIRDEVSEAALDHADRDTVRAAYRRTDYFEERINVMQRWSAFVCTPHSQASLACCPNATVVRRPIY